MDKPKVQIIIPVYNAEKFLRRCLDSLINQTYPHWEAIMVDDKSTDGSSEIVKEYQMKDNRITFYSFENNQGVSRVRNFALEKLSQKYVTFLDSDDFWEEDMLEVMVNKAEEGFDVVQCRFFYDYTGGKQVLPKGAFNHDVMIDKKSIKKIYYKMATGINMNHVCMKLIKTSLVKDLRFDSELRTAEDLKFCTQLFCKAESYYFINRAFYHYCRNDDSLTGKGLSGREKLKANRKVSSHMQKAISELGIDTPLLKTLCVLRPYIIIVSKVFRMFKEKILSE